VRIGRRSEGKMGNVDCIIIQCYKSIFGIWRYEEALVRLMRKKKKRRI
jgi:hypothetical protein